MKFMSGTSDKRLAFLLAFFFWGAGYAVFGVWGREYNTDTIKVYHANDTTKIIITSSNALRHIIQ